MSTQSLVGFPRQQSIVLSRISLNRGVTRPLLSIQIFQLCLCSNCAHSRKKTRVLLRSNYHCACASIRHAQRNIEHVRTSQSVTENNQPEDSLRQNIARNHWIGCLTVFPGSKLIQRSTCESFFVYFTRNHILFQIETRGVWTFFEAKDRTRYKMIHLSTEMLCAFQRELCGLPHGNEQEEIFPGWEIELKYELPSPPKKHWQGVMIENKPRSRTQQVGRRSIGNGEVSSRCNFSLQPRFLKSFRTSIQKNHAWARSVIFYS